MHVRDVNTAQAVPNFTYHEVTLHKLKLVRQTLLRGIVGGSVDLVVVVVKTGNMAASELRDFARRTTDTTSDVKNLHALRDADLMGEVVLMPGNSLVEWLAVGKAAEVEGLAPAILVQVGGEVVVATGQMLAKCRQHNRNG